MVRLAWGETSECNAQFCFWVLGFMFSEPSAAAGSEQSSKASWTLAKDGWPLGSKVSCCLLGDHLLVRISKLSGGLIPY